MPPGAEINHPSRLTIYLCFKFLLLGKSSGLLIPAFQTSPAWERVNFGSILSLKHKIISQPYSSFNFLFQILKQRATNNGAEIKIINTSILLPSIFTSPQTWAFLKLWEWERIRGLCPDLDLRQVYYNKSTSSLTILHTQWILLSPKQPLDRWSIQTQVKADLGSL